MKNLVENDVALRMDTTLTPLIVSVLVLLSFFVIGSCDLQTAKAQNMTESNLITYHSPDLGYTLKYPSNWELDEKQYI